MTAPSARAIAFDLTAIQRRALVAWCRAGVRTPAPEIAAVTARNLAGRNLLTKLAARPHSTPSVEAYQITHLGRQTAAECPEWDAAR